MLALAPGVFLYLTMAAPVHPVIIQYQQMSAQRIQRINVFHNLFNHILYDKTKND